MIRVSCFVQIKTLFHFPLLEIVVSQFSLFRCAKILLIYLFWCYHQGSLLIYIRNTNTLKNFFFFGNMYFFKLDT